MRRYGLRVTTWWASTRCCPPRTGQTRCCHRAASGSTCATPARWPRCWPVSIWCVTRPPWWVPASTPPTHPPMAATTISPPRCCWRRCSPPGSAVWCWRRRWWFTGRGAMTVPSMDRSTRCRGGEPTWTMGSSSTVARGAASQSSGNWSTRMPRCARAACTRPARPRRSTTRWRGRKRVAVRWWRCATTTSTAPACRATPPTPGGRDLPLGG